MTFLRSPQVHHIDLKPAALRWFAQQHAWDEKNTWIAPYHRPAYSLFQAHLESVVESSLLPQLHHVGRACKLQKTAAGWCVETEHESLYAKHVVLATGRTELCVPAWARTLLHTSPKVQHVLDLNFDRASLEPHSKVVVIGGGISAAQIALALHSSHTVTLLHRNPLQQVDFDSPSCWLGPKCMRDFQQASYQERRSLIRQARASGTLARDVDKQLNAALQAERLQVQQGEVVAARLNTEQHVWLQLADGTNLQPDYVVLATGLAPIPPTQSWLAEAIARYDLPLAPCEFPVVDVNLCWDDGLFVLGPLAELELGPTAANIAGARAGVQRMLRY